jgi:hypothetical protein
MRRASYQTVVQWVKDAWNIIPDRIIISGFIKAEILDMPEQLKKHYNISNKNVNEN